MDFDTSLPRALNTVADANRTVILLTAFTTQYISPGSLEQVNMKGDVLIFLRSALHSLHSFGRRNLLVLTNSPGICKEVSVTCGYQSPILPHEAWTSELQLDSSHFYLQFLQRWLLISKALQDGYTMLSLDTDVLWPRDPLALIGELHVDAAFASDTQASASIPPLPTTARSLPLNSGVMLARPSAHSLFHTVAHRVRTRLQAPPNNSLASSHHRQKRLNAVWPQRVLNEVVDERRPASEWVREDPVGVAVTSVGRLRVGVLPHTILGRVCGRRLGRNESLDYWGQATKPVADGGAGSTPCSLAPHGYHAQMVHARTRTAIWALLHPAMRPQMAATLWSDSLAADAGGASAYGAVAISSATTKRTCICRTSDRTACLELTSFDSYLVRLKRCAFFDPSA